MMFAFYLLPTFLISESSDSWDEIIANSLFILGKVGFAFDFPNMNVIPNN
jgi:hypothetical protein